MKSLETIFYPNNVILIKEPYKSDGNSVFPSDKVIRYVAAIQNEFKECEILGLAYTEDMLIDQEKIDNEIINKGEIE